MIVNLYSIRDKKASMFLSLAQDTNDETAIRNFTYAMNNSGNIYAFAPSDFALYRIGEFDTSTGLITPLAVNELICEGDSVVKKGVCDE